MFFIDYLLRLFTHRYCFPETTTCHLNSFSIHRVFCSRYQQNWSSFLFPKNLFRIENSSYIFNEKNCKNGCYLSPNFPVPQSLPPLRLGESDENIKVTLNKNILFKEFEMAFAVTYHVYYYIMVATQPGKPGKIREYDI